MVFEKARAVQFWFPPTTFMSFTLISHEATSTSSSQNINNHDEKQLKEELEKGSDSVKIQAMKQVRERIRDKI
jgi:hypothetical protein